MTVQDASALTHRAFLFADPAAHSLSPRMHRAAFAYAGLRGEYDAVRVPPAALQGAVADLRRPGVLGANVSLPHKEAVVAHLDALSDAARAIGAVNTVVHADGRLTGDNTDAPGLHADLREHGFGDPGDGDAGDGAVVVLGAGGAARAAVYAGLTLLGRDVYVVNRSPRRAADLVAAWPHPARTLAARAPGAVPWADVALVVNATSAGLDDPHGTPLDAAHLRALPAGAVVYDMVYSPPETRLLAEARAAGLRGVNGLGMLAQQARLAFLAWTAHDVPVGVFRGALGPAWSGTP